MYPRLTSLSILPNNGYYLKVTHIEITSRNIIYLWSEKKRLDILYYNTSYLRNLIGLGMFPNLKRLTCQSLLLTSLEGVNECPYLENIKCNDCNISSLEGISKCKRLQNFSCDGNNIESLEELKDLPDLTALICNDNLITSLCGLKGCHKLKILRCQGNSITTLVGLEECHELEKLYLKGNPLVSLQGLPKIPEVIGYDRKNFPRGYDLFRQFGIARFSHAIYKIRRIVKPKLEQRIRNFQRIWRLRHYDEMITYRGELINRLCYMDISSSLTRNI